VIQEKKRNKFVQKNIFKTIEKKETSTSIDIVVLFLLNEIEKKTKVKIEFIL